MHLISSLQLTSGPFKTQQHQQRDTMSHNCAPPQNYVSSSLNSAPEHLQRRRTGTDTLWGQTRPSGCLSRQLKIRHVMCDGAGLMRCTLRRCVHMSNVTTTVATRIGQRTSPFVQFCAGPEFLKWGSRLEKANVCEIVYVWVLWVGLMSKNGFDIIIVNMNSWYWFEKVRKCLFKNLDRHLGCRYMRIM